MYHSLIILLHFTIICALEVFFFFRCIVHNWWKYCLIVATTHLFSTPCSVTSFKFEIGCGGCIYARRATHATDQGLFPPQKAIYQQAIQDQAVQKVGDTVRQGAGREASKSHRNSQATLRSWSWRLQRTFLVSRLWDPAESWTCKRISSGISPGALNWAPWACGWWWNLECTGSPGEGLKEEAQEAGGAEEKSRELLEKEYRKRLIWRPSMRRKRTGQQKRRMCLEVGERQRGEGRGREKPGARGAEHRHSTPSPRNHVED